MRRKGRIILAVLAVAAFVMALMAGPAQALTDDQAQELLKAGLSLKTVMALQSLEDQTGRDRPATMTYDEVKKLLEDGFTDEHVRLLSDLDRLTGKMERMPVSPDQALELKKSGVSLETLRLMFASEVDRLEGRKAAGGKDQPLMGRKVETQEDGSKIITYWSGKMNQSDSEGTDEQDELDRAYKLLDKIQIHVTPLRR